MPPRCDSVQSKLVDLRRLMKDLKQPGNMANLVLEQMYSIHVKTCVASERVFCTAGDIVKAERACLETGAVNKMIFLK